MNYGIRDHHDRLQQTCQHSLPAQAPPVIGLEEDLDVLHADLQQNWERAVDPGEDRERLLRLLEDLRLLLHAGTSLIMHLSEALGIQAPSNGEVLAPQALEQTGRQPGRALHPGPTRSPGRAALKHEHGLTECELAVLELVAHGLSNQGIARTRDIAERTVEQHLTNSYRKLGVSSRMEAARAVLHTQSAFDRTIVGIH